MSPSHVFLGVHSQSGDGFSHWTGLLLPTCPAAFWNPCTAKQMRNSSVTAAPSALMFATVSLWTGIGTTSSLDDIIEPREHQKKSTVTVQLCDNLYGDASDSSHGPRVEEWGEFPSCVPMAIPHECHRNPASPDGLDECGKQTGSGRMRARDDQKSCRGRGISRSSSAGMSKQRPHAGYGRPHPTTASAPGPSSAPPC